MLLLRCRKDTLDTLVNVATRTTLTRNAKYLKHARISEEVIDASKDESDSSDSTSVDSSQNSQDNSAACNESEPCNLSVTQATRNKNNVTTRSGRTVKSTKDHDSFVYF